MELTELEVFEETELFEIELTISIKIDLALDNPTKVDMP